MSSSNNNSASASTTSSFSSSAATSAASRRRRFPKKLFLNVSPATTSARLYHFAERFGTVVDVNIPVNDYQQSRGFAFITFRWHEDAVVALAQLEGVDLDGIILHPRWATVHPPAAATITRKTKKNNNNTRQEQPVMNNIAGGPHSSVATTTIGSQSVSSTETPTPPPNKKFLKKKLFLDISPATTEAQLTAFLAEQKFGPVSQVHIPFHPEKQKSRGFAFVTFRWHEDAAVALEELDGRFLDGMVLHPRWAAATRAPSSASTKKKNKNRNKKEGAGRSK